MPTKSCIWEILSTTRTIAVDTGEVKVSTEPVILQSIALGSCVALIVYERNLKIGGIAHIMLPGKSPLSENTRYPEDAFRVLFDSVRRFGAKIKDLEISIVGGANVLQEGDIPERVVESVLSHLKKMHLELNGMRVGGIERRSVHLDVVSGKVFYTEGDDITKNLLVKIERT